MNAPHHPALHYRLWLSLHWLQVPVIILTALLQRTPVLRLLESGELLARPSSLGFVLRSSAVLAAVSHGVDTLVGATTVATTPADPASGVVGTQFDATFSVTGAPSTVLSYTVSGLPPGLTIAGSSAFGSGSLINASTGTITGVPTTAGAYVVTITAWKRINASGPDFVFTYTINVSGASGSTAPAITSPPLSQTVTAGQAATFSVTASGTAPLTYQWQKDGASIGGATGSTHTISTTATTDGGSYTVVVTNAAGSVTSSAATLTVSSTTPTATAPQITTQPASLTVTAGQAASFSVTASGTAPLSYQWKKDGADLAGATTATYSIAATTTADAGSYAVVVANAAGNQTSASATLVVNAATTGGNSPDTGTNALAPTISAQPSNLSVSAGQSGSFSIVASGGTGLAYQWQVSTNNGTTWVNLSNDATYSGATTSALGISSILQALNGNLYRAVVTNTAGTTSSDSAMLIMPGSLLSRPSALTVDANGYIYVSDAATNVVQRINAAGIMSLWTGSRGQAGATDGRQAYFNQPSGIAADATGKIYVADTANATIRCIAADRTVSTLAGSAISRGSADGTAATFSAPIGLALDAAGNVYVADSANHIIRKITPTGVVSTIAGLAGTGGYRDGIGTSARFNLPCGIACDGAGNVYVADTNNNLIRRISPAGAVSTLAGVAGASGSDDGNGADALFNQPRGLALSKSGYLYVADSGNSSVRRVTTSGSVTTLAGLPSISGDKDSDDDDDDENSAVAWFNHPLAVACDAENNIYVADTGNATIRRITPTGTVSTVSLSLAEVKVAGTTTTTSAASTGSGPTSSPIVATSSSGGSSGGGAVSLWSLLSLGALTLLRRCLRAD